VRDLGDNKLVSVLKGHTWTVFCLALWYDTQKGYHFLISGSGDHNIKVPLPLINILLILLDLGYRRELRVYGNT